MAHQQCAVRKCLDLTLKKCVRTDLVVVAKKKLSATDMVGPPLSYQEVPREEEQEMRHLQPFLCKN